MGVAIVSYCNIFFDRIENSWNKFFCIVEIVQNMKIIKLTKQNLSHTKRICSKALSEGRLIVVPTDTVYGLCVDAGNSKAVRKVIEFKGRQANKPISIFVKSLNQAKRVVKISDKQQKIINQFIPGPFTFVFDYLGGVDNAIVSSEKTLGIRIPDYKFINDLTAYFDGFMTATSANISGRGPHHKISDFLKTLSLKKRAMLDLIIDAGRLAQNKPSTVVDLTSDKMSVIREGDIAIKNSGSIIKKCISNSAQETFLFARSLAQNLAKGQRKAKVLILKGEMGAGKTIFVKGIGDFFKISDIKSPTFVICHEHNLTDGSREAKLFHIDLFRFKDEEEVKVLDFEKMTQQGNIICIEWGNKSMQIFEFLKEKSEMYLVSIDYISQNKRKIEIKSI